jgi:hypothetical protein
MKDSYHSGDEANQDKARLIELMGALEVLPSRLCRDESKLWTLQGRPGCYASTWGDDRSWLLVVTPKRELSKLAWTWAKKRLAFAEVTQDGDTEGCFRLHRLPSPDEAEAIRDILGLRKAYSPEELARRQDLGRLSEGNLSRHKNGL